MCGMFCVPLTFTQSYAGACDLANRVANFCLLDASIFETRTHYPSNRYNSNASLCIKLNKMGFGLVASQINSATTLDLSPSTLSLFERITRATNVLLIWIRFCIDKLLKNKYNYLSNI